MEIKKLFDANPSHINIKPNEPLTPEQIKTIDWIIFSREQGAPFNLCVALDPDIFNPDHNDGLEKRKSLFGELLDPSKLVPFYRWQLCRRVINPLWTKGSGFEGHLIGLSPEEIKDILRKQEEFLKKNGCQKEFQRPISLKDAINMSLCFSVILARMRAQRTILQQTHPENRQYQDMVYNSNLLFKPIFNICEKNLIIGFSSSPNQKDIFSPPFNDIRNDFPLLAEIGRFGFPPLTILLRHLSLNHLI